MRRWLSLWSLLVLVAVLPVAGRLHVPCGSAELASSSAPAAPAATHLPAAVLASPASQPPSPFLATASLVLKLPAAELGGALLRSGAMPRVSGPHDATNRTTNIVRTRIRILELRHDTYAAEDLAARAGLLSARSTAPPPPLV